MSKKFPGYWFPKIPTRYESNAIIGKLHRARKIANEFHFEVKCTSNFFLLAGFPKIFIRDTIYYQRYYTI